MSVTDPDAAHASDEQVVRWQLGRAPRGTWRVVVRCGYGFPQVIETDPVLGTGEPFPTLYYLTCPYLARAASRAESEGALLACDELARIDPDRAARLREAHGEVGSRRAAAAGGVDPCSGAGVAGQADPLATKCLHARIAAALAGVPDPVGREMLEQTGARCQDRRCGRRNEDGV